MKDRLERHKWVNQFPQNPTQTHYLRFLENPGRVLKSAFTKNKDEFENNLKGKLETRYTKLFEEGV